MNALRKPLLNLKDIDAILSGKKKKKPKKKVQGFNPATSKTQSVPLAGWDTVANPYKPRI